MNTILNIVCNGVTHVVSNAARTHVQNQTRSRVVLTSFCPSACACSSIERYLSREAMDDGAPRRGGER